MIDHRKRREQHLHHPYQRTKYHRPSLDTPSVVHRPKLHNRMGEQTTPKVTHLFCHLPSPSMTLGVYPDSMGDRSSSRILSYNLPISTSYSAEARTRCTSASTPGTRRDRKKNITHPLPPSPAHPGKHSMQARPPLHRHPPQQRSCQRPLPVLLHSLLPPALPRPGGLRQVVGVHAPRRPCAPIWAQQTWRRS